MTESPSLLKSFEEKNHFVEAVEAEKPLSPTSLPSPKIFASPRKSPIVESIPDWLRRPLGKASEISTVQRIVKQRQIHTICEEGRCPNRGECYAQKTATFLLMGPVCTRSCAFCQVDKGHAPMPLDLEEPQKVAEAVQLLGLKYVVLTSVARDDLPDGGASWFAKVIAKIRCLNPETQIEVLTSDFWGGKESSQEAWRSRIATVVEQNPVCYNHNIETVKRLQGRVRRGAKYDRSMQVLQIVKQLAPQITTKSGLMLGHGETQTEVIAAMADLRSVECDRLTIGQYMRPSLAHLPVQKYWTPEEFTQLGEIARNMGFSHVRSAPLVRSSYHAGESE
ncbi:lipoyl synthase [Synechocystis sp. PCC 7509]|uniref:lipoyl synthase n=1 Tax=Synechocystis sp. PCC 7509 TaxID=927677 RepID=UPI0002ABCC3B|nr:lipoyl synthase [Synechocystis sp. PCC 7509]